MIRKIFQIMVVLPLLVSTVGITVSKHYCGGYLKSISINSEAAPCCEDSNCCHNELETFQLKTDFSFDIQQVSFENTSLIKLFFVELFTTDFELSGSLPTAYSVLDFSPPPLPVGTFLSKIQVYLI